MSSVEIMKIFDEPLCHVFAGSEVLCLNNACGEGISLTHDEQDFLLAQLQFFPPELTDFLLGRTEYIETGIIPPLIQQALEDLLDWMLCVHPLEGKLRVCNKLLSLLQSASPHFHDHIRKQADRLQKRIEEKTILVFQALFKAVKDPKHMLDIIHRYQPQPVLAIDQTLYTGRPQWYKESDKTVDEAIVVQLLMANSRLQHWENTYKPTGKLPKVGVSQAQLQTILHLTRIFNAEYILIFCFNICF